MFREPQFEFGGSEMRSSLTASQGRGELPKGVVEIKEAYAKSLADFGQFPSDIQVLITNSVREFASTNGGPGSPETKRYMVDLIVQTREALAGRVEISDEAPKGLIELVEAGRRQAGVKTRNQ